MKNWKKIALMTSAIVVISAIGIYVYKEAKENKGEGVVDSNSKSEPLKITKVN